MLLRHSALYSMGRIIPAAVNLLTLALYTRLLTAGDFGRYALVIAGVGIANAIIFQWLNLSLGRFLQANDDRPDQLLSTALTSFTAIVIVTAVIGGVGAWLSAPTIRSLILIGVGITWAQAWYDLNLKIVNAQLAPLRYGIVTSTKGLLALGLGLAFFYAGFGVLGLLFGLMAGLLLSTLFLYRQWQSVSLREFDSRLLRAFLSYGAPLTLTFMLSMVLDSSDRFLLGWYIDAKAVGAYAAAYVLTQQSLGLLMGIVHLAAFPLAVRELEERGTAAARRQLQQNSLVLLAISLPATAGLMLLARNIARVMLGSSFQKQATEIIVIVALATLVSGIKSYYFDYSFQLKRRMFPQVWTFVWAALANIGLNLWWIPRFGVAGAAYSTLSAFLVALFVSWYLGRTIFTLPWPPTDIWDVTLATAGMCAVLVPTLGWRGPAALVLQIALGATAYVLILLVRDTGQCRALVAARMGRRRVFST